MTTKTIIANDTGHRCTKTIVTNLHSKIERNKQIFPTTISNARALSDESAQISAAEDTVEVSGKTYFVGNTVIIQDNPLSFYGLNDNWFFTAEYLALVKAGFQKARKSISPGDGEIIFEAGLPANVSMETRKEVAQLITKTLMPCLVFGETLRVAVENQAQAIIFHELFTESGEFNPVFRQKSDTDMDTGLVQPASQYAVIELGHGTTDYTLYSGIQGVHKATVSTKGVFESFDKIQSQLKSKGMKFDLNSVSAALITKQVDGQDVSSIVQNSTSDLIREVVDTAKQAFAGRSIDAVLVAGGGAPIVFSSISKEFPNAKLVAGASFAVAEGYIRRGLNRAQTSAQ